MELSIVMPCLNEAETLGTCIEKAKEALRAGGVVGEVVVADNGSSDGSQGIAEVHGARLVQVDVRGYGSALMGGIAAARGEFVVMGDADSSYDFLESLQILAKLREGNDLVQGCRMPAGGGTILPGAMPFLHRWCGNPMFSFLARWWFSTPIGDVYCGLRGFRKSFQQSLEQRCMGMEFAVEMIVKAGLVGGRIGEVPITLHRDGRKAHRSHLRTYRDGWRTLRFFLMCSPRWLFLAPGALLVLLGVVGYALALPGAKIGRATLDAHTLLFASLAILVGYQSCLFALFSKTYAVNERLLPPDRRLTRFYEIFDLEAGLALSAAALLIGLGLLLAAVLSWRSVEFGALSYPHTMRLVVPGATMTALGFQTLLSSFFVSILGMRKS